MAFIIDVSSSDKFPPGEAISVVGVAGEFTGVGNSLTSHVVDAVQLVSSNSRFTAIPPIELSTALSNGSGFVAQNVSAGLPIAASVTAGPASDPTSRTVG